MPPITGNLRFSDPHILSNRDTSYERWYNISMDPYRIIGVSRDASLQEIKNAYRKEVKKYHPDVSANDLNDHLRMIQLNRAYYAVRKKFTTTNETAQGASTDSAGASSNKSSEMSADKSADKSAAVSVSTKPVKQPPATNGIALYKDPGYAYYKLGYKIFSKIHPSQWWIASKNQFDVWENKKLKKESLAIAHHMYASLPKAYYYFSVVADEYPESMWARDAREKMHTVERMTPLYAKIVESFTTWPRDEESLQEKAPTKGRVNPVRAGRPP
jgi:curved DNA-binding protein CbpA